MLAKLTSFLKDDNASIDFYGRRLRYMKLLYPFMAMILSFFILYFNFIYHFHEYNITFAILSILYLLIPVLYYFKKDYVLIAFLFFTIATCFGSLMIFLVGGFNAPGIFWITIIPFVGGMLFCKNGIYLGTFYLLVIIIIFNLYPAPTFLLSKINYASEKKMNMTLYTFFLITMIFYFLKTEENVHEIISEKNRQTENLLRILFHDVASPLTGLKNRLKLIKHKVLQANIDDNINQGLDKLMGNVEDMTEILTNIRMMYALRDGKSEVTLKNNNPCIYIQAVLKSLDDKITKKNISIELDLGCQDILIKMDTAIFKHQIMTNLLTNAIKFSNKGGKIYIKVMSYKKKLIIKVIDEGIGIPEKIRRKIFNANMATSRKGTAGESGTGYGLPLVYEYVNRFGGSISVASNEKNKDNDTSGTTFTLTFPIFIESNEDAT